MDSVSHVRPLSIGNLLDLAIRLYRACFLILAGIVALPLIPVAILQIISELFFTSFMGEFGNLIISLIQLLSQGFVSVALVAALSFIYLQQPLSISTAYRKGADRFGTYILASIIQGFVIGIPFVILGMCGFFAGAGGLIFLIIAIPIIIFLRTRWAVVIPTIVLEEAGATEALGRSFNLTDGYFWRVFGTSTLASILVLIITWLPQLAIYFFIESMVSAEVIAILSTIISQIILIITAPLSLAVTTMIYYDLRIRKEGFDLQFMAETTQTDIDEILPLE